MNFKYRKINLKDPFSNKKYILRPIIPVSLRYKDKSIYYEALIDTGADFCIFPIELASNLGINILKHKVIYFSGVGGEPIRGFIADVTLSVGEIGASIKVVFAESGITRILGQRGFFDHFDVKLSYKKRTIEIVRQLRLKQFKIAKTPDEIPELLKNSY